MLVGKMGGKEPTSMVVLKPQFKIRGFELIY